MAGKYNREQTVRLSLTQQIAEMWAVTPVLPYGIANEEISDEILRKTAAFFHGLPQLIWINLALF